MPKSAKKTSKPKTAKRKKASKKSGEDPKPAVVAVAIQGKSRREPRFTRSRDGSVRIVHSELIGYANWPTTASSGWAMDSDLPIYLSPTNTNMFTWLPTIAGNFEEYRFHKLVIRGETLAASTNSGAYTMAVDFDALDALPTTAPGMESNSNSVTSRIWGKSTLHVDCRETGAGKLLFTGAPPSVSDAKTYYAGQLLLAYESVGTLSNGAVKFYVDYDVSLYQPQTPIASSMAAHFDSSLSATTYPDTFATAGKQVARVNVVNGADVRLTWQDTGTFLVNVITSLYPESAGNPMNCDLSSVYQLLVTDGANTKSSVLPSGFGTSGWVSASAFNSGGIYYANTASTWQSVFTFAVAVASEGAYTILNNLLPVGTALASVRLASYLTASKMPPLNKFTSPAALMQSAPRPSPALGDGPTFRPWGTLPNSTSVPAYVVPAPTQATVADDVLSVSSGEHITQAEELLSKLAVLLHCHSA